MRAMQHRREHASASSQTEDTFILSYPAKRYRSAWISIMVHSLQSVALTIMLLTLVNGEP